MAEFIFDWREDNEQRQTRYLSDGVRGSNIWREFADSADGQQLLNALVQARLNPEGSGIPPLTNKVLFISHQRADAGYAIHLADIAANHGFAVWLDILDPNLPGLTGMHLALYIEMALLNSTSLVAVYSSATPPSEWVPYEYGRVKTNTACSVNVSARIYDNLNPPDYMQLGELLHDDSAFETWLGYTSGL